MLVCCVEGESEVVTPCIINILFCRQINEKFAFVRALHASISKTGLLTMFVKKGVDYSWLENGPRPPG